MGKSPKQKLQKRLRGKKTRNRRERIDPRTKGISIAGPLKITRADGTVVIEKASPEWEKVHKTDYLANPYRKARPRKHK